MAVLKVLTYPDPFLKTVAKAVTKFGDQLNKEVNDMIDTMYAKMGIGLAATQLGLDKRVFVMDIGNNSEQKEEDRKPIVVINPEIIEKSGEQIMEEGCLSVIEFRCEVKRATKLKLKYFDLEGHEQILEAEDLLSVCIQHEYDHLEGKLFIDYLPSLKRKIVQTKLKKQAAQ